MDAQRQILTQMEYTTKDNYGEIRTLQQTKVSVDNYEVFHNLLQTHMRNITKEVSGL